jgi:hypothetical protein
LATASVVSHTTALVLLAFLRLPAITDARATVGVLAGTGFADIDAAERIALDFFPLALPFTALGIRRLPANSRL